MTGWTVTKESLDQRLGNVANGLREWSNEADALVDWLNRQDAAVLEALGYTADEAYLIVSATKDELASFLASAGGLVHLPKHGGLGPG